jgi:hypothetical protein
MTSPTISTTYSGRSTNWVALVLTVAAAVPLVVLGRPAGESWASPAAVPLAVVVACVLVTVFTASSVRALAGPGGVTVHFGVFGWPRFRSPIERIAQAEAVLIPPSHWAFGMYWSPRRGLMLTLRTGPALRLVLTNGRRITVSAPDPEAAVGAIEAARAAATRR